LLRDFLDGSPRDCYRSIVASGAIDPQAATRLRAVFRGVRAAPEGLVLASRAAIVGVVNVTPDSFSDGGKFLDPRAACAQVDRLIEEGADVIEVGGESTRPAGPAYGSGFAPVDARTQIDRVAAVIEYAARERRALVAVDTTSAEVAGAALDAGAVVVNDVSTLADVALAEVVAARGAWLVIMHARPGASSSYDDVVADVAREWTVARDRAVEAGVEPSRIVFDPGIGFGKGADGNLALIAELGRFASLGHPLYVGPSRKSFIGVVEERSGAQRSDAGDRLGGTIAACLLAVQNGACAVRVHDVRAVRQAFVVADAIAAAKQNRSDDAKKGGGA
jgi:dihydropteroate synthase